MVFCAEMLSAPSPQFSPNLPQGRQQGEPIAHGVEIRQLALSQVRSFD